MLMSWPASPPTVAVASAMRTSNRPGVDLVDRLDPADDVAEHLVVVDRRERHLDALLDRDRVGALLDRARVAANAVDGFQAGRHGRGPELSARNGISGPMVRPQGQHHHVAQQPVCSPGWRRLELRSRVAMIGHNGRLNRHGPNQWSGRGVRRGDGMSVARGVREVGFLDCAGGGQVTVDGNFAYIGHMEPPTGTTVVDVSDPRNPRAVAHIKVPDGIHSHKVRAANGLMLVNREGLPRRDMPKGERGGLGIFDISDPRKPVEICNWQCDGTGVHRFTFDGRYAYLSPSSTAMSATSC